MKRTSKIIAFTSATVILLAIGALSLFPLSNTAVAATPDGNEQYKVLSAGNFSDKETEIQINALAKTGWKVRTGFGSSIILAK
jgi:hypothetical protein